MRTQEQLHETIDRYRNAFWAKKSGLRPPVSVVDDGIFLPLRHLRRELNQPLVAPREVGPELSMSDYEFEQLVRRVHRDDWIPFTAAWRGVPWLEAWCGCPVRVSSGSLAPAHYVHSAEELAVLKLPHSPEWIHCLHRETQRLFDEAPADCLISPTILRGASDVLGALRGLNGLFVDLFDAPETVRAMAQRINKLLIEALDMHFSVVHPRLGGYGHVFGYWAPEKTICLQEDAMGMCSPGAYRDLFMEGTAEIVRHLGPCVLFHLHTTGYRHYRDVLHVPGMAGLQFTIEANGPSLLDMLPVFREVLEKSRLILFVDHGFEQLDEAIGNLPHEGLYLLINQRHLPDDAAYGEFICRHWGR